MRLITFILFCIIFFIALMLASCTQRIHVRESSARFTIACDSITLDSTWYEPVVFRVTEHRMKHNSAFLTSCQFRITERTEKGFFAFAHCSNRFYLVQHDLRPDGYIRFTHPDRTINFRILNIVKL